MRRDYRAKKFQKVIDDHLFTLSALLCAAFRTSNDGVCAEDDDNNEDRHINKHAEGRSYTHCFAK